jgi:hypothetical protein
VQFWELYSICNEKVKTIVEVWVQGELRVSFRRTFTEDMMQNWGDLLAIVEQVRLGEDTDALVWTYEQPGTYSTQSFYVVISYRGVTQCTSQLFGI